MNLFERVKNPNENIYVDERCNVGIRNDATNPKWTGESEREINIFDFIL